MLTPSEAQWLSTASAALCLEDPPVQTVGAEKTTPEVATAEAAGQRAEEERRSLEAEQASAEATGWQEEEAAQAREPVAFQPPPGLVFEPRRESIPPLRTDQEVVVIPDDNSPARTAHGKEVACTEAPVPSLPLMRPDVGAGDGASLALVRFPGALQSRAVRPSLGQPDLDEVAENAEWREFMRIGKVSFTYCASRLFPRFLGSRGDL